MKTVLLTGSEGYIAKNFKHIYNNKFIFVSIDKKIGRDVLDFNDFDNIDAVIHLAAISGIIDCDKDSNQTYRDNIEASVHLLRKTKEYNIPMVFASSQAAKNPDTLYATTKSLIDNMARLDNGINSDNGIKVLRFANVYGGLSYLTSKDSVMSKFVNAKLNNEQLIINGDGQQSRDFVHVNDICKCIYKCMFDDRIVDPVDVGTGKLTSIETIAKMISDNYRYDEYSRTIGVDSSAADSNVLYNLNKFKAILTVDDYVRKLFG